MSQRDSFRVFLELFPAFTRLSSSVFFRVFSVALRFPQIFIREYQLVNTKNEVLTAYAPQPAVMVAATVAALVFGSVVMFLVTVGQLVA